MEIASEWNLKTSTIMVSLYVQVCAGKCGVVCSAPVLERTRSPLMLRLYSLIGLNEWLQWDADGWPPESAGPLQAWQQTAFWAAAGCYISTDVRHPPPLSHGHGGMCRCWSIIVRDQARADDNESTPLLLNPSQAHDFLCRTQAPFVRPQVTHDPLSTGPQG